MLPPSVSRERSSQGAGLCAPAQQQGQELSTLKQGRILKCTSGEEEGTKIHLCFILSIQFKSNLQVFLACNQPSYYLFTFKF